MNNAPFFDKQPKDKMTEIFCLIGSNAWEALGYDKKTKQANGEEWQLLCQLIGRSIKKLPLVLGSQQLDEIPRLKLTDTQTVIRFCQFGEISETQKTALLQNIAQKTPLERVFFADNIGQISEDVSDYIQRLRTDETSQLLAQQATQKLIEKEPKRTPYIEYRETDLGEGLFYIVPVLEKESGMILYEKEKWVCDNLELAGQGKDLQGEYYYLFKWKNADEKQPRIEAVHLADFGSEMGWKQQMG